MKMWVLGALAGLVLATPASAETREDVVARMEAMFGDAAPVVDAIDAIQAAVSAGDGPALAEYFAYGSELMVSGEAVVLDSEHDLYERYDELITPAIAAAVSGQAFETLFVNAEGVMFGNGEMWISPICLDETCSETEVKITALNSP